MDNAILRAYTLNEEHEMSKQKIVTNGMVALAIMLFVFMYFKGKQIEEESVKQEAKQLSVVEDSEQVETQEHEAGEPHHHYDVSGQSELDQNVRPIEDAPEDERSYELSDFYTAEEIQQGKELATQFSKSYYAFNGNDMTAHVKAIEPITEAVFYEKLLSKTGRATNAAFRAEITNLEVQETYDQADSFMLFTAFITGNVYGSDNTLFEEQAYVYYIKLKHVLSELKVADVRMVKVDSR